MTVTTWIHMILLIYKWRANTAVHRNLLLPGRTMILPVSLEADISPGIPLAGVMIFLSDIRTHIWVIIDPRNGFPPVQSQAFNWIYVHFLWNGPAVGANFSGIWTKIQWFSCKKMQWKMSSAGVMDYYQHWFSNWPLAWWYKAITLTNFDSSSMSSFILSISAGNGNDIDEI